MKTENYVCACACAYACVASEIQALTNSAIFTFLMGIFRFLFPFDLYRDILRFSHENIYITVCLYDNLPSSQNRLEEQYRGMGEGGGSGTYPPCQLIWEFPGSAPEFKLKTEISRVSSNHSLLNNVLQFSFSEQKGTWGPRQGKFSSQTRRSSEDSCWAGGWSEHCVWRSRRRWWQLRGH